MDLNQKAVLCPHDVELRKNINFGDTDTTLCLNGLPFGETNTTSYSSAKNNLGLKFPNANDDGCRLVLGLGPPLRAYDNDFSNFGSKKRKEKTIVFAQHVPSDCDSILQLGLSGGTNETSSVLDSSGLSENDGHMSCLSSQTSTENSYPMIPIVDEGSTSTKKSSGYMASLLVPRTIILQTQEPSNASSYSHGSSSSENRTSNLKRCNFVGCTKGARGASGFCIGHGGGQRCQKPGCNKGTESRTAYCKAHGGGRRCEQLGCTKSAEGKTDYCIAHGGGKRCGYPGGCTRAARGKSGLCIKHGGGKRCKIEGCNRSAEGQAGLCISHGGGRRCQHQGCTKGAQGSTMFCKAHGGGKRCSFAGCTKGAEGSTPLCKAHGGGKRCLFNGGGICPKSVHGGTHFCVAHGGGKRCAVPDCTKSARGRTDCCVKHGGGKRCQFECCGKSAQGSTDLCKAHGGGKRCVWGEGKCEKFARGKSGLCAAHSSFMMQERETNKVSLIAPRLFHGVVSTASNIAHSSSEKKNNDAKLQHLIPKEVLVPFSMKSFSSSCPTLLSVKKDINNFNLPEGRVHGGDLMLYLGGSFNNAAYAIWSDN